MAEEDPKSLNNIPDEVILKKRKSSEECALEKKEQLQQTNLQSKDFIKKPEDLISEFGNSDLDHIRRVKRKLTPKSKALLIIRTQRKKEMSPNIRKVLYLLGLRRTFSAVFMKPSEGMMRVLKRLLPFVTYGFPNLESIKKLIYKKGYARIDNRKVPLTDNSIIEKELGKFGIVCIEDMVHQIYNIGPHFKEVIRFMWPFKMNKPAEGSKGSKTPYKDGGDTGTRDDPINELINKMNTLMS